MRNRRVRMAVLAALSSATAFASGSAAAGEIAFDGTLPGTSAGTLNALDSTPDNYLVSTPSGAAPQPTAAREAPSTEERVAMLIGPATAPRCP